jgi:subtilisin-like proprotein convertase family protein
MSTKKTKFRLLVVLQVSVLIFSNLTAVSSRESKRSGKPSPETVYSNATPVTINTTGTLTNPTVAATYPSQVTVSGMTGTTTRVAVTLRGLSTSRLSDLDFLLVGPGGEKYIFLSDAASSTNGTLDDKVLVFSDDAFGTVPGAPADFIVNYKPTSGDGTADTFPAPAPAGPYNQPPTVPTFAGVYNGINPNGTWSLYVADDINNNASSLNTGWSLDVTTSGTASTVFTNSAIVNINDRIATSTPYGTTINVSGETGVITDLNVTLTGLSHTFPSDIDILLVSPNGKGLVLLSDAGSLPVTNADLTFDDSAPNNVPSGSFTTGTFKPTDSQGGDIRDTFPDPAPLRNYHANNAPLSNFNGFNPNGDWTLYIVDDNSTNSGTLAGGWSLDITTGPAAPPPPLTCSAPSFVPTNIPVGTHPVNLAGADFNNDTKPDLIVANQDSNNVSVLLGNGDGTFTPGAPVFVGAGPYSLAVGKFDSGATWDFAVTNSMANTVSVLLGNGDGTFASPANINTGPTPLSVATGDFNEDTKTDLAVANYGGFLTGSVSILFGNGSGGFTAGNSVQTRSGPAFVAVGNLNPDAHNDLVIANFGAGSVSTFFGTGTGTFNLSQHLNTGAGPISIDIANYNADVFPDFRVAGYNSDSITGCNNDSTGLFSCSTGSAGQNPTSVASADFTGGGGPVTEALALAGSNQVKLVSGNVSVGQNPNAVETFDLNGDSDPDLVTANSGSNDITIMLNQCAAASGNLFDFNGDKRTDYTVWRSDTSSWLDMNLNPFNAQVLGRPGDKIVSADYTGDRVTDFAVWRPETGAWTVRNLAGPVIFTNFGLSTDIPAPADYDGDGKADIAVFRPSTGHWFIRQSSDNTLLDIHWGMAGDVPVPTDYDDDGKDDIAVFRPSVGDWYVLRSSDMAFQAMHWGANGDKPVPGDYDSDGLADFAVFRPSDGAWYVFRTSDSGFTAMNWGAATDKAVPGDYEGDGKLDFAVWRPSDQTFYVLKSSDGGALFIHWGVATDFPVASAFVP